MMQYKGWEVFVPGKWCNDEVDVRDFIQRNYTPYEGDSAFLAPATEATKKLWQIVCDLTKKELAAGGVLNADTKIVSTLTSHGAGYLDKDLEKIVGLNLAANKAPEPPKPEPVRLAKKEVVEETPVTVEDPTAEEFIATLPKKQNRKKVTKIIEE